MYACEILYVETSFYSKQNKCLLWPIHNFFGVNEIRLLLKFNLVIIKTW